MLVVQAHVVGEDIQRAVVREGLWEQSIRPRILRAGGQFLEHVMLGDEVARARVQAARQETAQDQVVEGVGRGGFYEDEVEEDLGGDVEEVDRGERDGVHEDGSHGVEEDLEGAEEGFAQDRVEEDGFERGG